MLIPSIDLKGGAVVQLTGDLGIGPAQLVEVVPRPAHGATDYTRPRWSSGAATWPPF